MSRDSPKLSGLPFRKIPWKVVDWKRNFVILEIINSIYLFLKNWINCFFFLLVKLYAVHAVSLKSTKISTSFRMKLNFQKMHHTPYEVVSCWLGCFKWNFGSILLEQISYQGKDNIQWNDGCKAAFRIGCTKSTN